MDKRDKVLEVTARRKAIRQGLQLSRSRVRDRNAPGFGCYALFDATTGKPVWGVDTSGAYHLSLEQAERYLISPRKPVETESEYRHFLDEVIKHKKKWGAESG